MKKSSTINLHNIKDDLYLGYCSSQPHEEFTPEISYFGGRACWLYPPEKDLLLCSYCPDTNLTFLGQIYCPLNADHCYHRVLYILYCQHCRTEFKCIRQQAKQEFDLEAIQPVKDSLRKATEHSYEIENEAMPIKQLNRMMLAVKRELDDQKIIEEEDESEEEDIDPKQMKEIQQSMKMVQVREEEEMEEIEESLPSEKIKEMKEENSKFDEKFQIYKKVIHQIDGPSLLYTNVPVPYNSNPINPQHHCQECGNKMGLEVQITEKVLLLESLNPESKLIELDWGSLLIFTCQGSCAGGKQECVVPQYEKDSIKEDEIKKLKKKKKNKKKKQKKQRSKSKNKQQMIQDKKNTKSEQDDDWD